MQTITIVLQKLVIRINEESEVLIELKCGSQQKVTEKPCRTDGKEIHIDQSITITTAECKVIQTYQQRARLTVLVLYKKIINKAGKVEFNINNIGPQEFKLQDCPQDAHLTFEILPGIQKLQQQIQDYKQSRISIPTLTLSTLEDESKITILKEQIEVLEKELMRQKQIIARILQQCSEYGDLILLEMIEQLIIKF